MNNNKVSIETFEDLLAEKARLEMLIQKQKNIVRHDVDELRAEFRKEARPVVDTATFFKKLIAPANRNKVMLNTGAAIAIDLAVTGLLSKSHFLLRMMVPGLVKNYAGRLLSRFHSANAKKQSAFLKR